MISVAKGYADYEKETLEKIVSIRVSANQELSLNEALQLQGQLGQAVTKLVAIAEAYPDLKADKQFIGLQTELIETENRIAQRRLTYNSSVNLYLNRKLEFPSNLIASLHEFPEKLYFDAPDEITDHVPIVKIVEVEIQGADPTPALCDRIKLIRRSLKFLCIASTTPTQVDIYRLATSGKAVAVDTIPGIERIAGGHSMVTPDEKSFYVFAYAPGDSNSQRLLKISSAGKVKSNVPVSTIIVGARFGVEEPEDD